MIRTPVLGVDVVPERQRDDVQLVLEVVQPDADRPGATCRTTAGCRRPRGSRCGGPSRRSRPVSSSTDGTSVHQQDPARLADALDVLAELQPVELALLRVPVGADALERRRPVHERVGHDADLRVAHRDVLALEVADQRRSSGRPPGAWCGASAAGVPVDFSVSMRIGSCGCARRGRGRAVGIRAAEYSTRPARRPQPDGGPPMTRERPTRARYDEVERRRRRAGRGRAAGPAGPSG